MVEACVGNPLQVVGERARLFRRQVEPECLDGDEPVVRGFIGPKNRTENAGADLMQNPEWSERRWRRRPGEIALSQRWNSSGGFRHAITRGQVLHSRILHDLTRAGRRERRTSVGRHSVSGASSCKMRECKT